MQQTFDTPEPISLYVELGEGDLTLRTHASAQTVVDVTGEGAEDVSVELRGDQLAVVAPRRRAGFFGRRDELRVDVSLPEASALTTKLGSADVTATGRLGEVAVRTGSGDVTLEQLAGEGLIETGSGDVLVARAGADLRVKSGSGDIRLDLAEGDVTVSTGSGDIELGTTHGTVQVKSGSGDLRVREAHDEVALSTASGDLVVDRIHRGALRASNVSGDISIGVPSGIPVWTDISSVTGSVRSNLVGAGQPGEGQDYIELRAKTVSGDVSLEQL